MIKIIFPLEGSPTLTRIYVPATSSQFILIAYRYCADHMSYYWYMARFFNSEHHNSASIEKRKILTVTVEESCHWLLDNCASDCCRIVPVTVEKLFTATVENRASDCWTIVSVTVKESCQPLLKNCASDYWTTAPATVQQVNALTIMSVRKYLLGWLISYKIWSVDYH